MWAFYEEIRDTMDKIKFDFTKTEYLRICDEAMLSNLQRELLEDKIKGLTIVEMSMKRGASPEKVKREIKKMKKRIFKVI